MVFQSLFFFFFFLYRRLLLQHVQKYQPSLLLKSIHTWLIDDFKPLIMRLSATWRHITTHLPCYRLWEVLQWRMLLPLIPQYHLGSKYCGPKLTTRKIRVQAESLQLGPQFSARMARMTFPEVLLINVLSLMVHKERTLHQASLSLWWYLWCWKRPDLCLKASPHSLHL